MSQQKKERKKENKNYIPFIHCSWPGHKGQPEGLTVILNLRNSPNCDVIPLLLKLVPSQANKSPSHDKRLNSPPLNGWLGKVCRPREGERG